MTVTVNREQRLYVIQHNAPACPTCHKPSKQPGYVTCYGFDNCQRLTERLAAELGQPAPTHKPGTLAYYRAYQRLLAVGRKRNADTGWRSTAELTPALVGLEGRRVQVTDEDGGTRRFIVGKSTGWMPCHLEIARRDSTGGPAVLGGIKSVTVIGG